MYLVCFQVLACIHLIFFEEFKFDLELGVDYCTCQGLAKDYNKF